MDLERLRFGIAAALTASREDSTWGYQTCKRCYLVQEVGGEILEQPPDPANPIDEFNKVLSEAREIRERATQGLHASIAEPAFAEAGEAARGNLVPVEPEHPSSPEISSESVPLAESVAEP